VFFSRQLVGGVPWAIFSKLFLFASYLGVSIILVRGLGAEQYGVFSLCKNLEEYCAVVCSLGLNTALLRFLPELVASRNRAGAVRLLQQAAALQVLMAAATAGALCAGKPYFDRWFNVDFQHYLLLTALWVGAQLSRDFVNDAFTALFRVRALSLMSLAHGALWLGVLGLVFSRVPQVHVALWAPIAAIAPVSLAGAVLLIGYSRRLEGRPAALGVSRRRAMKLSLLSMLDTATNMLLKKYTEVFFLGVFFAPAIAGMYDLACSLAFVVVTFIPFSVQKLLLSGFAEAYVRDEQSLGRLVAAVYRALILTVVPLAVFGIFLAPRAIRVLYGAPMEAAGPIASLCFALHALSLVYLPLSLAIVTKEKILNMLPLTLLQIALNVALDYLLIPRFGMYGAVAAVSGAFLLSCPLTLRASLRIVGGIFFPGRFFARIAAVSVALAALPALLAEHLEIAGLGGAGIAYAAAYFAVLRQLRLVRAEEVAALRNLGFAKLNRALDYLVATHRPAQARMEE
jgi:O-antigen/teichoic acid export membrane protein